MTAFQDDPAEWTRLDWQLLQNGAVVLYHQPVVLGRHVAWLTDAGYRVVHIDCAEWPNRDGPHASLARALDFPDYYGANLDALADILTDVDVPASGGLALVLERLDAYVAATDRGEAQALLDVFEGASRHFLLTGHRFLVLAQSDDPQLTIDPVGARPVVWNPDEWLTSKRIPPVT